MTPKRRRTQPSYSVWDDYVKSGIRTANEARTHVTPPGWKVDEYVGLSTQVDSNGRPLVHYGQEYLNSLQEAFMERDQVHMEALRQLWHQQYSGLFTAASSTVRYRPGAMQPEVRLSEQPEAPTDSVETPEEPVQAAAPIPESFDPKAPIQRSWFHEREK